MIKRVKVKNFKSFENIDIELRNLNLLIGSNAAGKTNFVNLFRFLKDIANQGLENAIQLQGGTEYLRNIGIDPSKNMSVEIVSDQKMNLINLHKKDYDIIIEVKESVYSFALSFNKEFSNFEVVEDRLVQKCTFLKNSKQEILGDGEIIISNRKGFLDVDLNIEEDIPVSKDDVFFQLFQDGTTNHPLILGSNNFIPFPFKNLIKNISIYDFDPNLSKKAIAIIGKNELEENASNLPIVLNNIFKDEDKRKEFFALASDILPFVEKIKVNNKAFDKSLILNLNETYFKNYDIPASFISDGTIAIIFLITALYFEDKPLAIIEEPERGIHPHLISKIVNMMYDVSSQKQIIITTHNPEVVKHINIEDLLFIFRNKDGFSEISKPNEMEEVKIFLRNELGIEDLFVQNLIGD